MNKLILRLVVTALTLGTAVEVLGTDIYVATNGNNSTYTNWSTAYTNIQDALNP